MSRVIAIANQKGGVGKTTTNVNLSACVAEAGKKVLAIDIDPQGNTTSGLGVDKSRVELSIYDVLINDCAIQDTIVPTSQENLSLVPSSISLAGAEIELVSMLAREHILKNALQPVREAYDFIFIDCPPSLGLLTINALTAADRLLVPIQCEYYALEGLSQLLNTVQIVRKRLNPQLDVEGVVLTMFDGRTNLSVQVVDEVKKYFKNKVYSTIIPRNVRLGEAPSHGLPIIKYDKSCTGAEAYTDLAEELIDAWEEEEHESQGIR
ncbi:MAG: ParA family protein [Christensenellales bacterium]|jgi:chromosome partitioning protein